MRSPLQLGKLTVIEGGGGQPPALLDLPSNVLARSPLSRDTLIGLRISTTGARRALELNRRQPSYDLWAGILGQAPPAFGVSSALPDGSSAKLNPLSSAYACFRGLRRPVADDVAGFDVFAYVHRVDYTFTFSPSMARCVSIVEVPKDLIFVTYVKLDYPEGRPCGPDAFPNGRIQGVVTHWAFVEATSDEPALPVDFKTRYRKRMW